MSRRTRQSHPEPETESESETARIDVEPANISLPLGSDHKLDSNADSESESEFEPEPGLLDPTLFDIHTNLLQSNMAPSNVSTTQYGSLIQFAIDDKLDEAGTNYNSWMSAMEIALSAQQLFDTVTGVDKAPADTATKQLAAWRARDSLAKAQIGMNISMVLLDQLDRTTAHSLYTSIKTRFDNIGPLAHALASRHLRSKIISDSTGSHFLGTS